MIRRAHLFLLSCLAIVIISSSCSGEEDPLPETIIDECQLSFSTSTLAGIGTPGYSNGSLAQFNYTRGVIVDSIGNVYVADYFNHCIRKITASGSTTLYAGQPGSNGYQNGAATSAAFNFPTAVAVDRTGNVFVTDVLNQVIRKISPSGFVSTYAGNGASGYADGPVSSASFRNPIAMCTDIQGNLIISDQHNHVIRKITPSGMVSTIAGVPGVSGFQDGPAAASLFNFPRGVKTDQYGNIYVADTDNHRIRKISNTGIVTTLSGTIAGYADGNVSSGMLNKPCDIAVDALGNIYIADALNHRIRLLNPQGKLSTVAGSGAIGFVDGPGLASRFHNPYAMTIDKQGRVLIGDDLNHSVRIVTPSVSPNCSKVTVSGGIF